MPELPVIEDITSASQLLDTVARITPLLESEIVNKQLGGRILVKAECLQVTGSFKIRGAWNKVNAIPEKMRNRGVVAYSSGNHAQGVAATAKRLGIPATIVMPFDAPQIKKENTRLMGATIVEYDREIESREAIGAEIANNTGATLVKPYDDFHIIAGQGTVGLETCIQAGNLNVSIDQLLSPCGGGGLIAGVSLAMHHRFPRCEVYAVEPLHFEDTTRSLSAGKRLRNTPGYSSLCDSIVTPEPGELTFEINRKHLAGGIVVDDNSVLRAMRMAFDRFKIVVEPGGAVALAAVLDGQIPVAGKTTLVICSGGNVDPLIFARCLSTG
ncbi:MAG: serine/threonine dehydratase [marine bacterium B5-7]|nr:MAG: serine/threonine dehydratase [marine bacterium B5-7]